MIHLDLGACFDLDPAAFYPEYEDESTEELAKSVCACCAVRLDCLALALQTRHLQGVWGGLTAAERARYTNANQ